MRKATPEDVVECYRLFVRREPENQEVVLAHLHDAPELWEIIKRFAQCCERSRQLVDRACSALQQEPDARRVEVDVTPENLGRLVQHIESVWTRLGADAPYWSVCVSDIYLSKDLSEETIDHFYQTGCEEVAFFEAVCARNRIEIDRSWRILELGCGVGRVGEHFASAYAAYIGVDISSAHLRLAQQHFAARRLVNSQFFMLKDFLTASPTFDVFFSLITLQHNPPPMMLYILNQSLERLAPGGYAFFQLPCHLYDYKFDLAQYLAALDHPATMEVHALPQPDVFKVLAENGLVPIEVFPSPRIGPTGFSYGFFARKGL